MKRILVIREFDEFSRILSENGFEIINLPTIETKPLKDLSDFEAKLETIENYDGIFITSKIAAQILAQKIDELNINFAGKVYVLGRRSFEILKNENLNLFFDETANTAHEMLESIDWEELELKKFLFVRGENSLRYIAKYLGDFSDIDETIVYETRTIAIEIEKINSLREDFEKGKIMSTCFFSPSGAESFIKQFGLESFRQTKVAAIGNTTADFIKKKNLKVAFVSPKATAKDFAESLIEYLRKEN